MNKRKFSILLAIVLIFSVIPFTSFATESENVYISISYDGQFVDDVNGNAIAYVPVPIETLESIDLSEYGLEDYYFDGDGDGENDVTALHLYIYTHEQILGLDWSTVRVSGGSGSIFFEEGLFGFGDCNLTYYLNGVYPESDPGWGATVDIISLSVGDFCDIAGYTSWEFYMDSAAGFNYFSDGNEITHAYITDAGQETAIKLVRSGGGFGGELILADVGGYNVYYGKTLSDATGIVTTDESGEAMIPALAAGNWYLWCDGGCGAEYPDAIVSAPAYATLNVKEAEKNDPIQDAIAGTTLSTGVVEGETVIIVPTSQNNVAMTENKLSDILDDSSINITSNEGKIGTGCKIAIGENEVNLVIKGDIDGDGVVTVFDALMVKKALANNGFENEALREFAGNVDDNSETDEEDVRKLLLHIVGSEYIE